MREYEKEMIHRYRKGFPDDKRDDNSILKDLRYVKKNLNLFKPYWIHREVYENKEKQCRINPVLSRVCKFGTRSCELEHLDKKLKVN